MSKGLLKPLFITAAIYDLILGFAFTVFPQSIFQSFDAAPPEYMGYVQFPALLMLIFAAMFFRIASDPVKYRFMIWYGVGLKVAYSAVAFWYYFAAALPWMWMPWAVIDVVFLVLFLIALAATKSGPAASV